MKNEAGQGPKSGEFRIRVRNGSGGSTVVVIRNTFERIELDGHDFFRYRIIQPEGYENEDILHRLDRGYEGLLTSVFMALSEAGPPAHGSRI